MTTEAIKYGKRILSDDPVEILRQTAEVVTETADAFAEMAHNDGWDAATARLKDIEVAHTEGVEGYRVRVRIDAAAQDQAA